ncbi:hypothetical protein [Paenibacillus alba]|uniref:Uncharacterized protein n=1 Tax=Paenibacillus alba TaxID=1197127 RepID=A0ABU6GAY1_9BACL|nr:hypothetical protein [Paenibacillus alba]MEC0230427.1 hypothetical protein [Paenibacillus alba]
MDRKAVTWFCRSNPSGREGLNHFRILTQIVQLVLALNPTVLLFFFAQNYLVEGIALTGMKGKRTS